MTRPSEQARSHVRPCIIQCERCSVRDEIFTFQFDTVCDGMDILRRVNWKMGTVRCEYDIILMFWVSVHVYLSVILCTC